MNPGILLFVAVIAGMYFLLLRPQQQRLRRQRELVSAIGVGDCVITAGGLFGRVVDVANDRVQLEIAEGVTVEFLRLSISRRIDESEMGSGFLGAAVLDGDEDTMLDDTVLDDTVLDGDEDTALEGDEEYGEEEGYGEQKAGGDDQGSAVDGDGNGNGDGDGDGEEAAEEATAGDEGAAMTGGASPGAAGSSGSDGSIEEAAVPAPGQDPR